MNVLQPQTNRLNPPVVFTALPFEYGGFNGLPFKFFNAFLLTAFLLAAFLLTAVLLSGFCYTFF
ncbi:hypothetical protein C4F51_11865 [Cellvibrio sp. KB43]|uniref:Uncharacterized protein n=1 Tax=Cellvibrio polysaccharolyticus TaxID=2082724 RepID=A0A928V348_9GAMM|nr:hypothetical protein [Cellvibrio polysaccharolyticus]